jgi:hypothetical protein
LGEIDSFEVLLLVITARWLSLDQLIKSCPDESVIVREGNVDPDWVFFGVTLEVFFAVGATKCYHMILSIQSAG